MSKVLFKILLVFSLTNNYAYSNDITDRKNTLVLGFSSEPTSIDPHHKAVSPNVAFSKHIYDALFYYESDGSLTRGLADSYRMIDENTWDITIKKNIIFHDGSILSIDDVIYSFNRVLNESLNLEYRNYLMAIKDYKKIDPFTIRITTQYPYPAFIKDLADIRILNKSAQFKTPEEINKTHYSNGTGPYKLVKHYPNGDYLLERNPYYFNNFNQWEYVKIVTRKNKSELIEAFVNGDIDVIEKITPKHIQYLKTKGNYTFVSNPSNRLIYLYLDQLNEKSPYITDNEGLEIINPLLQRNVRAAISMAIDRNKLCSEILNDAGYPTLQYVSKSSFEYDETIPDDEYNPIQAKKLLQEVGLRDGFQMKIHGPNNRYLKDEIILTSIATMLKEVGINASAITMDKVIYFEQTRKYSMGLSGWATSSGKILHSIDSILSTYNPHQKIGLFNSSRYSNKIFDHYIELARQSFDTYEAYKYSKFASDIARNDYAIIPLYFEKSLWAMQPNIRMLPQTDMDTFASRFVRK